MLILTNLSTNNIENKEKREYYKFSLKNSKNGVEGFILAKKAYKDTFLFSKDGDKLIRKLVISALGTSLVKGTGVKHSSSESFRRVCGKLGLDWVDVAKKHVENASDITVEANDNNDGQVVIIFQHSDFLFNTKDGVECLPNLYLKVFVNFDSKENRYCYSVDFHDDPALRSSSLEKILKKRIL